MDIKIIYQDNDLLAVDKPAGLVASNEATGTTKETEEIKETLINLLIEKFPELTEVGPPPRYGLIHRLDKDTSGVILIAKNKESLAFFQKQFKERTVEKKYLALAIGDIKNSQGIIETTIRRSPKDKTKQKAYPSSFSNNRNAITEYKVIERFKNYTLIEASPKTGRKHQIRCHLTYINHPIAGDKIYNFKNQPCPEGLKRHFLHSASIKIRMPNNSIKEINSPLAEDLAKILEKLEKIE